MKLSWNLFGGGGGRGSITEKPSVEGVKIFSGTTHYTCNQYPKYREKYSGAPNGSFRGISVRKA